MGMYVCVCVFVCMHVCMAVCVYVFRERPRKELSGIIAPANNRDAFKKTLEMKK